MSFERSIQEYYVMRPDEDLARDERYLDNRELIHACLGLSGETGELVDLVKKTVNYGKELDTAKLLNEAGDVIHYLARILDSFGFTLEDAKAANLNKLQSRFPHGYTDKAAIERKDVGNE
jgi:NTP pyrophosphatase (non-canonical NTP hydrolase)